MNGFDDDRKGGNAWYDRLVIKENNKPKAIFDIALLLMVAYSCFTSIYYISFEPPTNDPQKYFDYVVEIFFVTDLVLNFFQGYRDNDTYVYVRDVKLIAKHYVIKGSFVVDFIAVFPFQQILEAYELGWTKLFRLFRLPRLFRLIDIGRFNQLLKRFFENSSRDERIVAQYMLMYGYRIFRLVIIAIIITYIIGCFWYLISTSLNFEQDHIDGKTFVTRFGLIEMKQDSVGAWV